MVWNKRHDLSPGGMGRRSNMSASTFLSTARKDRAFQMSHVAAPTFDTLKHVEVEAFSDPSYTILRTPRLAGISNACKSHSPIDLTTNAPVSHVNCRHAREKQPRPCALGKV